MADPLSIAAGVIGILTAAAQVSHLLINFTRNSKDAPQTAQIVLTEVNEISGTLSHLQSFLLGNETLDRSRTQLLQVDQVVTVVSGCVLTFSELEKLLDSLKTDNMGIRDCVRWARKEKLITGLVQRLQNHKASLSLVLHILNSNTLVEAKSSVDRLQELIEHCYKEMSSRVEALELQNRQHFDRFSTQTCPDTDVSSIRTVKGPNVNRSGEISRQLDSVSPSSCFTGSSVCDYVESLQKSWVYRRSNALDPSRLSIYSRDGRSMTWSTFSGISCEEISQISVIGLPIHIEEVYNPRRVSQTWTADKLVHSKPNAPVSYYKVDKNKQALLFMPSEVSLSWACNLHQYMPDRPCKLL
ncbi:MAG: hypothetical protein L6R42_002671 [Xanthoria sp. 1 TBL-2021]|nr:MAG: hypothetical protein L6R42_002671 [Xanthoria sp. 1 TBL-2021]